MLKFDFFSDKIYKSYFEKLTAPLTALFKKANEVQSIFLNTINTKIDFCTKDINDIALLAEGKYFCSNNFVKYIYIL